MQFKSLSVLYLALAASGVFAQAKPPEPDYTLAYNIGVATDYRFRGISQTRLDPSVFGRRYTQAALPAGHERVTEPVSLGRCFKGGPDSR